MKRSPARPAILRPALPYLGCDLLFPGHLLPLKDAHRLLQLLHRVEALRLGQDGAAHTVSRSADAVHAAHHAVDALADGARESGEASLARRYLAL